MEDFIKFIKTNSNKLLENTESSIQTIDGIIKSSENESDITYYDYSNVDTSNDSINLFSKDEDIYNEDGTINIKNKEKPKTEQENLMTALCNIVNDKVEEFTNGVENFNNKVIETNKKIDFINNSYKNSYKNNSVNQMNLSMNVPNKTIKTYNVFFTFNKKILLHILFSTLFIIVVFIVIKNF